MTEPSYLARKKNRVERWGWAAVALVCLLMMVIVVVVVVLIGGGDDNGHDSNSINRSVDGTTPAASPVESISTTTGPPTVPLGNQVVLTTLYSIAIPAENPTDSYRNDLIASMDLLAPEVLAEVPRDGIFNTRLLRHRRLAVTTVQLPTAIDELVQVGTCQKQKQNAWGPVFVAYSCIYLT
jgi:hypothetical protein